MNDLSEDNPTVDQVWERYLELMGWAGFPEVEKHHKRESQRRLRQIKQMTPLNRRALYQIYTRRCQEYALRKMQAYI